MIAVIDYGMGNLRSVQKALERVGADARIVETAGELARAEKIILPGVGAFADAIARLRSHGLAEPIRKAVEDGTPFLGICLGLQLLFEVSFENGEHKGLGILGGQVRKFSFEPKTPPHRLSIPHMGWNEIHWQRDIPLLSGIRQGAHVYFAHSYHVEPTDPAVTATVTDYGYPFTSSVETGSLFATQFHPEKSQAVGRKLLENFVRL